MVQTLKCPSCGSELVYEGGSKDLTCTHCGQTISVEEIEKNLRDGKNIGVQEREMDTDGDGLLEFKCPSCGANLITNDYTAATTCSFCGNSTILSERLSGEFKPSRLIPFAFNKEEAKEYFKKWKGRGIFTPSSFKSEAVMNQISGVYVPYWLYSYQTDTTIHAKAERVHRHVHGDYEEISTEHFLIHREAKAAYEDVPYDASKQMPDDEMAYIEPYDYTQLVPFQAPFLSGFAAEKYNYTADDLKPAVQNSVRAGAVAKATANIHGYTSVHVVDSDVRFSNEKTEYVMLPVWTLNYTYQGKKYPLYMNGSTGTINGVLPLSPWKAAILFGLVTIGAFFLSLLFTGVIG